ncbi:hypothetical protein A2477_03965 [Candidatus Falkowbacteria bacterium RIFOXYC2_FULL_47_12]|uniref:Acetyltransferase n=2 Tax=Candidatus Falkowiibacteriota TaxID=1752728 RepID=A0A1F5TQ30_9BACT|nr:MAG: hypothetical protein A2242_04565 [Candidatus Falkowbacteria bacterium RIFOXYA2_FULL_47_9]OGF40631.1 MAG: hypothetical protein A2477_03965 [Candidatus Falkowbacteria bacterium RIFOXYC2_FULL_47_12]
MDLSGFFKKINVTQGADCTISEFCSLENVVLGDSVIIGDGVQLKNVAVGNGSKIGVNVRLYSPAVAQPVTIGQECWLSYGVFGEATGGEIHIEDYAVIAHRSLLLTSSGPGKKNAIMDALYPEEHGPIRIGAYCWLGTQCTLLPGAILSEGVVLGAHALARGGVYEAWTVYAGIPAKFLKKFDAQAVAAAKRSLNI